MTLLFLIDMMKNKFRYYNNTVKLMDYDKIDISK